MSLINESLAAIPILGATAALTWRYAPVVALESDGARVVFAFKTLGVCTLLTMTAATEAVAHERLFKGIAPIEADGAAAARRPNEVNVRVLAQTHEQLTQMLPSLVALAACSDSSRPVLTAAAVWVMSRHLYWLGYSLHPRLRVGGLIGSMIANTATLLYFAHRFGREIGGTAGSILLPLPFLLIEAFLVLSH